MKKLMSVMAVATISIFMLAGCENMSAKDQRIGAAALGGAVGGAVGSAVGKSIFGGTGGAAIGGAIGGGAGAAIEQNNRRR